MCATAYYCLINWILMFHGPLICERPQQYNMIMEMPILYTILSAVVIIDFECQSKRFKSHSTLTKMRQKVRPRTIYYYGIRCCWTDIDNKTTSLNDGGAPVISIGGTIAVCGIRTGATYLIQLPPNLNRRDYRIIPLPYDQIDMTDTHRNEINKITAHVTYPWIRIPNN